MWKCPNCGQKNRIDTCSKCGFERKKDAKASISSFNFIIMAVIALAIIIGIFFLTDYFIETKNKAEAEEARLSEELSEELYENAGDNTELIIPENMEDEPILNPQEDAEE